MVNVLLITSNFEEVILSTASCRQKTQERPTKSPSYGLGILYIHSTLESYGHNVRTHLLDTSSPEECFDVVIKAMKEFSPDVIGFQMFTSNRVSTYRLIEYIHKKYPDIQLVIGGVHATIMYRQLIEEYPFLIAVIGEGEITFPELVECLNDKDTDLTEIDGIAFYHAGSVVETEPRELIRNLDSLPSPKHEVAFYGVKGRKRIKGNILTSRGCPNRCTFCVLKSISMKKVRFRSVKNVVDEIEYMINNFPEMESLWFHDDTFFVNNKRAIEICDEIIKRGLNKKIRFVCNGRMKPLSAELISKLEQANFKHVLMGLESGDENILKACKKNITRRDAIKAFTLFSRSSISITVFLIVGLPGETHETILNTAKFVQKLQRIKYTYYNEDLNILTVYPGTEIYEIAKARDMIDDAFWLTYEITPLFTAEHSVEQLLEFKEILLDHIALDRLFTIHGMKLQFKMIPYILKYSFGDGLFGPKSKLLFLTFLESILPRSGYESLIYLYRRIKYGSQLPAL